MSDLISVYNKKNTFNIPFSDAFHQAVLNAEGPNREAGNYHTEFSILGHRYYASVTPVTNHEFAVFTYDQDEPDFGDIIYCRNKIDVSFVGLISAVADFIIRQIAVIKGIVKENR